MDHRSLRTLLEQYRAGEVDADAVLAVFRQAPVADLGFALLDRQRALRCGFPEVVFAEGKSIEQLESIVRQLAADERICLVTRITEDQAARLLSQHPQAQYDRQARMFWLGRPPEPAHGKVVVVSAGTSDLPIVKEAAITAGLLGCSTDTLTDVGVAGLHRLLLRLDRLQGADCIVVAAGMEGTLASVVGGLVDVPVVAIPTSIGYGANLQGVSALLGMLTSCAPNVVVVNIDAGFCAGYVAGLIARRSGPGPVQ